MGESAAHDDSAGGREFEGVSSLSGRECVERLRGAHQELLAAEVTELRLIAQLADIHGYTPDAEPDGESGGEASGEDAGCRPCVRRGRERALRVADGTPQVGEFLAVEVGAALRIPDMTARCRIRDVLELRHRHPHLWAAVIAGRLRVWVAQKIVRATRAADLTVEQANWVDAQTVEHLDLPTGRLLGRVDALIVQADPKGYELRRLARLTERFARVGESNEYGLKAFYAQADAADVIFVDAMVARVADILAGRPAHAGDSLDVRRAAAFGLLARPAELAGLLAGHTTLPADMNAAKDTGSAASAAGAEAVTPEETDQPARPQGLPDEPGDLPEEPGDLPEEPGDGPESRTLAGLPIVLDPAACAPRATLYLHLSEEALRSDNQIARIEGIGPATLTQLRQHLAGCRVTITPVINLGGAEYAVDSYEIPERMRRIVQLRHPYETAPYGTRTSRSPLVDLDHATPYQRNRDGTPAAPGQTRPDNLGPLGRFTHRARTHGRLRVKQVAPGAFLWITGYGQVVLADADGCHDLGLTLHPGPPDRYTDDDDGADFVLPDDPDPDPAWLAA